MTRWKMNLAMLIASVLSAGMMQSIATPSADSHVRFANIQVVIDSHDQPLAAYQLELKATSGDVKIVGIEGGEHAQFSQPPYYDPAAMQQERVIIAAFSTARSEALPKGQTRVATIHLQITGDVQPQFTSELTACATANGKSIEGQIILKDGQSS